jgi:hypothetical protein
MRAAGGVKKEGRKAGGTGDATAAAIHHRRRYQVTVERQGKLCASDAAMMWSAPRERRSNSKPEE